MATEGTKLPAVYKIPSTADPQLKLFAESVREILEVRLGRRGDPRDRFVTLRELIDSGLAKELKDNPFEPNAAISSVGFTASFEDTERITSTIPPKPTGFTVAAAYTSFNLSWNHPQLANFAYTEIWRHTSNDVSSAVRIDTTPAHVWSEEVGYAKTYYYWVRHVTKADVIGPFSDVGSGSTSIDIGAVMTALTEDLQDLPGYDTLQTLISGSAGTAATVIKSSSAPTTRANGDDLTANDIWYDTDDGQVHTRNSANNAWVAARDATLVNVVGTSSYTGSSLTAAMSTAQSDVVTLTNANSARASEINSLTATVDTKARTFVQDGIPTATAVGDIWIDSNDNNKMYRAAAADADQIASGEWVLVRDTLNDDYPRVFTASSAPTAINTGDIWFDTDDSNKQYRWDGSSWTEVRDVLTQAAVTTEAEARAEEDAANASAIESLEAIVNTKAKTFVQDGVPTATAIGDLWIDSNDSNKLYRAASATADQITSGEWVLVRDTVNDGKTTVFTNASPPTANNTGDLWFDSDDSYKQYRWDGSNWQVIRDVLTQASVTTVQNAVANGTSAEAGYGISVNANNAIAGMYLMASSNGTMQNNTSTSDIIFEADQVSIRNPHGTDIVPFTVLTSTDGAGNPAGVYINQAYLKDASIAAAQIGSVNAGTISAGTISAERIGADTIDASKLVLDDTTLTSQVINGTPTLKVNALSATLITSDTLNSDRINVDTLNVKSFDNVSSTIVSHVTAATKFPLARDGQAYIQRTSVYTGSDGSFVPVTITQVRDNAGYVAVFSGVLGDVDGGRVQYSLNNSTWVDANGNTDISWSAGTYRGYTYVYTGQITTLSASQSTVYWRVYFSGTYNHTQLSLNIMMDNTR